MTSVVIREMQIVTIVRFHLTSIGKAIIQKTESSKYYEDVQKTETVIRCWWVCKLIQPMWKTTWIFLLKVEIRFAYDLAI